MQRTKTLQTRETLANDLRKLGLVAGMTVIVHSSLSSIGWVNGGPVAVVQALMDVITPEGTIVMPTHSGENSDPSTWGNPPVPEEWWSEIRNTMPAFDPQISPTRMMGKVVEVFRAYPGVTRSYHPTLSFAAWGKHAQIVTANHSLDFGLGEGSPLARIYELNGYVLLLGVSHENNTSFHLAENRMGQRRIIEEGSPILKDGQRVWEVFKNIEMDSDVFEKIGEEFEQKYKVSYGQVGIAPSRLFNQKDCVDFAQRWFEQSNT
nr:AAC(3) family N-acetyltransferase [Caldalkalibacillus mannanilyticus]